jgi:hypothetical protein
MSICGRRIRCWVVFLASSFILAAKLEAQQPAPELVDVLHNSEYAFRRFEDVTSRINYNVWSSDRGREIAPSSRTLLKTTLQAVAEGRRDVAETQSQGKTSVSKLFELYDDLLFAAGTSHGLSLDVQRFEQDPHLGIELTETATLLTQTSNHLRPYVVESIRQLEALVASCGQAQK